jgi:hypothetical protein
MPAHAVAAGMRALREIEALDVDDDDCPLQRVEILECGQLTEAQVAELVASQDAKRKAQSRSAKGVASRGASEWPDDPGPLYQLDLPSSAA